MTRSCFVLSIFSVYTACASVSQKPAEVTPAPLLEPWPDIEMGPVYEPDVDEYDKGIWITEDELKKEIDK